MYNSKFAKKYWEDRLNESESLNTVLYYAEDDNINHFYDVWEKIVIGEMLGSINRIKILDVPAGIGRWTKEFIQKNAYVDCVDISEKIIQKIKEHIEPQFFNQINYYVSEIDQITKLNKKYDVILCTGLFEHIPQTAREKSIKDFSNILNNNGKLILVINNSYNKLLQQENDNPYRKGVQYENGYFCEITDVDLIINKLADSGFTISHYAINPSFSLIRQILKYNKLDNRVEKELIQQAVKIDTKYFSKLTYYQNDLADQIVILGRKII